MLSLPDGRPAVTGASCDHSPTPFPSPPHYARKVVTRLPGLRAEWRRLARRLAESDVELDADTVAVLLLAHDRLRAAGGTIDAMAAALVTQLRLQLHDVEATVDG